MKIKWAGNGMRVVGNYQWSEKNDWVQDVKEPELALDLLTQPNENFMEITDMVECAAEVPAGAGNKNRRPTSRRSTKSMEE